jgi:hypothetical protein
MGGSVGKVFERAAALVIGGVVLATLGKLAGLAAMQSVSWLRLLLIDLAMLAALLSLPAAAVVGFRVPAAWWRPQAWRALRHEIDERRRRERSFQEFLRAGRKREDVPVNGPAEPVADAPGEPAPRTPHT